MKKQFKLEHFDSQVIPLSPDDLLQITTIAVSFPIVIEIEGTALDMSGALVPFRFVQHISATVTPTTNQFRLGYSALLSVVVHTRTASIPDGDCYCRLSLVKSLSRSVYPARKLLSEGYLATYASIGYGSPSINGAPSDHFFTTNILAPSPIAGANMEYLIPSYSLFSIQCVSFTFTSDATVVSRKVLLTISLPSGAPHQFTPYSGHTASATVRFSFGQTLINFWNTGFRSSSTALPPLFLPNGTTIATTIDNIQAADQISDIAILTKRKTIPY